MSGTVAEFERSTASPSGGQPLVAASRQCLALAVLKLGPRLLCCLHQATHASQGWDLVIGGFGRRLHDCLES